MKLSQLLFLLEKHGILVQDDRTDDNDNRTVIVGCPLPRMPYGENRYVYATLVFGPGEDDVSAEERDALKRRLHHLTTDIFGDDPEHWDTPIDDDVSDSHFQSIVPKKKK